MNKGGKAKRPAKGSGNGKGQERDGTYGVDPAYLQEALRWYNSIPDAPVPETRPTVTKFADDDEPSDANETQKGEEVGEEGEASVSSTAEAKAARAKMMRLKQEGEEVLEKMVSSSKSKRTGSSEEKWLRAVSQSGTMSDKVGAAVMLVKSAPLQSAKPLENLLVLAKKKGEKANLVALDALRGLFLEDLLPDDRRLLYFREQPWQAGSTVTREHLLYWYYEEELKLRYARFVSILGECSKSSVQKVREVAIKIMFDLLSAKPEQEKQLLTLLVNKMGDPERKVASKAVFLLHQLLIAHPNMKFIVVREAELFAFRAHVSQRAQYYSMIFLNQIILLQRETAVSVKLVEIYFKMFTGMLEGKGAKEAKASKDTNSAVHSRILSAVLTGMNRAIPFVPKEKLQLFDDNVNDLYRLVHSTSFNKSVQILFLLLQIYKAQKNVPDRYFSAVYSRLHADDLGNSKRVTMFLNVLYQTMKVDKNKDRVFAFVKRILQLCLQEKPSLACGALFMISEVLKVHRGLWTGIQQPEDNGVDPTKMMDDDEEDESKGDDNRGYDPMKRDPRYARAPMSCFWELSQLEKHYHPSVKVLAKTLRSSQYIDYGGDPMQDFAMVAFLDKFVYKNPKKRERLAGGSIMQSTKARKQAQPLNSEAFLSRAEGDVPGDELFFYRYFQRKATQEKEAPSSEPLVDSDDDVAQFSDSDDDDDHVIDDFEDAALMGGPGDSDSDEAPEFDYGDMDLEEDDDLEDPDEKLLEQMIMEEGSDIEDDDDDDDIGPSFAAAEEYEHLFEEDKLNPKQERWESERANKTAHKAGSKRPRGSSGGKGGKRRRK